MLWLRRLDQPAAQALSGTEGAEAPSGRRTVVSSLSSRGAHSRRSTPAEVLRSSSPPQPRRFRARGTATTSSCSTRVARRFCASRLPAEHHRQQRGSTPRRASDRTAFRSFSPMAAVSCTLEGSPSGPPDLYVGALDSAERTLVLEGRVERAVPAGTLLFLQKSTLMAAPFDANRRTFTVRPPARGSDSAVDAEPHEPHVAGRRVLGRGGDWPRLSAERIRRLTARLAQSFRRTAGGARRSASYADVFLSPTASERRSASSIRQEGDARHLGVRRHAWHQRSRHLRRWRRVRGHLVAGQQSHRLQFHPGRWARLVPGKPTGGGAGTEESLLEGGPQKSRKAGPPMASRSSTSRPPQIPRSKTSGSCRSTETGLHGRPRDAVQ